jgi:aminopeptidase N
MLWLAPVIFKWDIEKRLAPIIAHELAHHWWGGLIQGTGPGGLLLQEGIATYCELLYTEDSQGREAYQRAARRYTRQFHRRVKNQEQAPIAELRMDHPLMWYLLYLKGAIVFHRLRGSLGDTVFFDVLKTFCQSRRAGAVTVDDFRVHAEQLSRADLKRFFQCALYETNLPSRKLIKLGAN